jgi:acetylornithine deacetylase/succinyl-diaminopimelate desuccinylase-like protein
MTGAVGTVGGLDVSPGAGNVVPEQASATFDVRAADGETLMRLVDAIARVAEAAADGHGCEAAIEDCWQEPPIAMSADVRAVLARAAERCCAEAVGLDSGAGHDAGILASSGVATGMLFVRSLRGGISHRPEEHSDPDAVACGTQVLADALAHLATRSRPA